MRNPKIVRQRLQRSLDPTAQVRATAATPSWTMRSTLRDRAGRRMHWPLESESLSIAQGQPSGVHRVECQFEWTCLAALPREVVPIHNPFDRYQRGVMRAYDRSALRRWPASWQTSKPPAMCQKSPEPISNFERAFDRELRQVVRQVPARCHRRALKWSAVRRRRDPAAEAAVAGVIEFDEHSHRVHVGP